MSLFDMDALESEATASDFKLPDLPDIEEVFDVPHLSIDTADFAGFLNAAKTVAAASNRDAISRSLSISVEGEFVALRATDYEVFLEVKVPLRNLENVMTDHLVIPYDGISDVLRGSSSRTTFLKKEDRFYIRIMGGDLILENFSVSKERFQAQDLFVQIPDYSTFPPAFLLEKVKDLSSLVAGAQNTEQRRLVFQSGEVFAHQYYTLTRGNAHNFPDMDVRARDFPVLRSLFPIAPGDISLEVTAPAAKFKRYKFSSENFSYVFTPSNVPLAPALLISFSEVSKPDRLLVDTQQFSRLVGVSSSLSYATGHLFFNFDPQGRLQISLPTKKSTTSVHYIEGLKEGNPQPLRKPLDIQSKQLELALKCYKSTPEIAISISERGIGIAGAGYRTVVYLSE